MLDHLALRLRLPKHEPQPLELKPEPPKLKSPGAETFSLRSPGAKAIGAEAFDPGTEASGAKATIWPGTRQICGRALDWLFLLFLAPLGALLAGLGPVLGALGRSWVALGRSWASLGSLLGPSGPLLGGSWVLLAALEPHLERYAKIIKKSMPKMIDLDPPKPPQSLPK